MFGEYDGSTILVLPESSFSSSLIDIFGRSHNHHKHHGYDRATATAWSGRSANHVPSRPGIHPLGLMMATAATTGTTITPAAPAPSGAVEVQIASRPVPLVTCGRSTSCSVFSFQIPVNADKDADGVVAAAAAAATVVDDVLYILSISCLFL